MRSGFLTTFVFCLAGLAGTTASFATEMRHHTEVHSFESLDQLVDWLPDAPHAAKLSFVETAVAELSDHYLAQAAAAHDDDAWAAQTRAFVSQLWLAVDAAEAGGAVQVLRDVSGEYRVVVSGEPTRQFVLTSPQPRDQQRLLRAVLEKVCSKRGCRSRLAEDGAPHVVRVIRKVKQRPQLVAALSEGDDGLYCKLQGQRHTALVQRACDRLAADLRALLVRLHAAMQRTPGYGWWQLDAYSTTDEALILRAGAEQFRLAGKPPQAALAAVDSTVLLAWIRARLEGKFQAAEFSPPTKLVYGLARMDQ